MVIIIIILVIISKNKMVMYNVHECAAIIKAENNSGVKQTTNEMAYSAVIFKLIDTFDWSSAYMNKKLK